MANSARILVVDDEAPNRRLMRTLLESEGYSVLEAPDGEEGLRLFWQADPDLVLLDLDLPGIHGTEVCRTIKRESRGRLIPVVIVTGTHEREARLSCITLGADEFLTKPFDPIELGARVRSLVALKRYTDDMDHATSMLASMAQVISQRDQQTGNHCGRVSFLAERLGRALGLNDEALRALHLGGLLHDLGKIAIPDAILGKTGRLTEEEFAVIRSHPVIGAQLLAPLRSLEPALHLVRHHHERLDGSGYPDRLKAADLPMTVRILSVADIFDVLTSTRPYKEPLSEAKSLEILREEGRRGWWDLEVIDRLESLDWRMS